MNEPLTEKEMLIVLRLAAKHGLECPVLFHQVIEGNYALRYLLRGKSILVITETADYFRGLSFALDPFEVDMFVGLSADFIRGFKGAGGLGDTLASNQKDLH
jgi:hypothetical protein